jgi:hypothetical protein
MPAGHTDLLDGIYGDRAEGLRALEIVALRKKRLESGFIGANRILNGLIQR